MSSVAINLPRRIKDSGVSAGAEASLVIVMRVEVRAVVCWLLVAGWFKFKFSMIASSF